MGSSADVSEVCFVLRRMNSVSQPARSDSVNEKGASLLLLHIMTTTHTSSQDSSTLEKCVIVMGLGLICETVVHSLLRLILSDAVFVFCF